jgi:hypothetical protein
MSTEGLGQVVQGYDRPSGCLQAGAPHRRQLASPTAALSAKPVQAVHPGRHPSQAMSARLLTLHPFFFPLKNGAWRPNCKSRPCIAQLRIRDEFKVNSCPLQGTYTAGSRPSPIPRRSSNLPEPEPNARPSPDSTTTTILNTPPKRAPQPPH